MLRSTLVLVASAVTLNGAGLAEARASSDEARPARAAGSDADCHRVESERFVFHNDPWINLHHFLFQWARNQGPPRPEDRRRAVEVSEQGHLAELGAGARASWERAVAYYRERLVPADLLFDRDLVALRGRLAEIACSPDRVEGVDAELRTALEGALPVYRRHWWPEHRAANAEWIRARLQALESYEAALASRMAEAYGGEWPAERIRVDVVAYANWAGAYTTNEPDHVTVETSYEGLQGVEILFHEVSHASFLEQRLLGHLAAAFRRSGTEQPNRLAHAIQFVTPAEILRSLLSDEEREDVRLVADAMAQRRRSQDVYRVVNEHWQPFLEGKVGRNEVLDRIAGELSR